MKRYVLLLLMIGATTDAPGQNGSEPTQPRTLLYDRVIFISVGISKFSDPRLNLNTPAHTASELAHVFGERYGYDVVPPLVNESATKKGIEAHLARYTASMGERDALVLFISTHGASVADGKNRLRGYLVPYDAQVDLANTKDAQLWDEQAISMHCLGERMKGLGAQHVLVLVEACCSGYMGLMGADAGLSRSQELLASRPSRAAITAGTAQQHAVDGAFGEQLLTILQTQRRAITSRELHLLVRDGVMARAGNQMVPQFRELIPERLDADEKFVPGEFVFVPKGITATDAAREIQSSQQHVLKRMGDWVTASDYGEAFESLNPRFAIGAPFADRAWEERVRRFQNQAAVGNPFAMAGLSLCYSRGAGVVKDEEKAHNWAREAFESGHVIGKLSLGLCYRYGIGVQENRIAGRQLIDSSAESGIAVGQLFAACEIYDTYASGVDRSVFPAEEAKRMAQLAEGAARKGSTLALVFLGQILIEGRGITPDPRRGLGLWQDAAKRGSPVGQFLLASAYKDGIPGVVAPDQIQFQSCLRAAAEGGLSEAQCKLGRMLVLGRFGFKANVKEGVRWLEQAANQRNGEALYCLYSLHAGQENYLPPDYARARKYLEEAVEIGFARAKFAQGVCYAGGLLYATDVRRATSLCIEAAHHEPDCAEQLARQYELASGDFPLPEAGSRKNNALFWYQQAARSGCDAARQRLKQLAAEQAFNPVSARKPNLPLQRQQLVSEWLAGTATLDVALLSELGVDVAAIASAYVNALEKTPAQALQEPYMGAVLSLLIDSSFRRLSSDSRDDTRFWWALRIRAALFQRQGNHEAHTRDTAYLDARDRRSPPAHYDRLPIVWK